jgi:tagatose 1,6-diphosphate aldolase
VLETVSFTFKGEDKKDKSYLDRKAATVLESARQLSRFCDVYKAEFPGTNGHESDSQLMSNLKELNRLSERPWVLLSAGVDYPMFKHQVEMAMECGASGVLGGRAFWKEYFDQGSPEAADKFLRGEACNRVAEINEIVQKRATPLVQALRSGYGRPPLHAHRREMAGQVRRVECGRGGGWIERGRCVLGEW